MQMGWDTIIDPMVLEPFDYAALGHIHIKQQVNAKAWYAGSPDCHGFGEDAEAKAFLLVDVTRGAPPVVTEIPTHPRPLLKRSVTAASEWTDMEPFPEGAIIRLELHPRDGMDPGVVRDLVQVAKDRGASFVQTVIVEPETEAEHRRTRVADAERPLAEQMEAWLGSQDAPDRIKEQAKGAARRALAS